MAEITRDGRDADRELPESVVRRAASQGEQQSRELLAGVLSGAPHVQGVSLLSLKALP